MEKVVTDDLFEYVLVRPMSDLDFYFVRHVGSKDDVVVPKYEIVKEGWQRVLEHENGEALYKRRKGYADGRYLGGEDCGKILCGSKGE